MTIFNKPRLMTAVIIIITTITYTATALADSRGRVEGAVTDPEGAKISAARVTLRNLAGVTTYETRTDSRGSFSFDGVAVGRYALAVEAPGFAQPEKVSVEVTAGKTETINIKLEIAAISDRIIVSATRTETELDQLGGSASVIAENDFKRAAHSLISEPLRLVPGLVVAQTSGRGGLTSIFTRGGESDYNKVLIDGVPVNAAGGLFDFASLTTENVERVEVVRGPRSSLFGSDAMTGVIHMVTRRGSTSPPQFELSGEGGSFDYHRETALFSGLHRWLDYSGSFGFQSTDSRVENNDYINRSASANIGFRLSSDTQLRVTSRWNNNTLGVPGATAILFADPDQRQKHRDLALAATLDVKSSSAWHHTARGIYSEFDTHSFDPAAQDLSQPDRPPAPPGSFLDFAFSFREHQKRAGIHYQATAAMSNNVITAGLDFEHESAVFTDDFSRVSPRRNNLGLYVQDQIAWRERLFVTAGLRLERNTGSVPKDLKAALESLGSGAPVGDVGFGYSANPRVGVSFLARPHQENARVGATRLRASFGTGLKEPSLTEAFSPSIFFLGNPALDPERATSFDVGVAQELFSRRASVELTYFDNRFRDQIIFTFDPATFGPVRLGDGRLTNFINVDRASARGIELSAAARPALRLRMAGSYTFLRTRLDRTEDRLRTELGLPLVRRPRHSGSFELIWSDQKFEITVDGSLVGGRRDIDPVTGSRLTLGGRPIFNDGYAKLNGAGTYRLSRFVTAFARVENLLNQDYEEILGFPAYRLNFSAGLRLQLGGN
jgi:vitamin B12 transporter